MFGFSGVASRRLFRPQPSEGPSPRQLVATAAFAAVAMNSRLFMAAMGETEANRFASLR